MPTSIDPQPAENEFECANCGAYFHYELTRCPNCGVNLYEPEDETESIKEKAPLGGGLLEKLKDAFYKLFKKHIRLKMSSATHWMRPFYTMTCSKKCKGTAPQQTA